MAWGNSGISFSKLDYITGIKNLKPLLTLRKSKSSVHCVNVRSYFSTQLSRVTCWCQIFMQTLHVNYFCVLEPEEFWSGALEVTLMHIYLCFQHSGPACFLTRKSFANFDPYSFKKETSVHIETSYKPTVSKEIYSLLRWNSQSFFFSSRHLHPFPGLFTCSWIKYLFVLILTTGFLWGIKKHYFIKLTYQILNGIKKYIKFECLWY